MKGQLHRVLRRFVVADASMEPTLVAGQGLITTGLGDVRPGQIRCFEHPQRPGFWLVKRVIAVHQTTMTVASDNPRGTDSRHFGDVPLRGSFRVLFAIPQRFM